MITAFSRNYSAGGGGCTYSTESARYFNRPTTPATTRTQFSTPNGGNHWPQFLPFIGPGAASPIYKNFCSFWAKSNLAQGTSISNHTGYFMTFSQGYGDSNQDWFGISYGNLNQIVVTYRNNSAINQIQNTYQLYQGGSNATITGLATRGSRWEVGGPQTSNANDFVHLAVGLSIPPYSGIGTGPAMSTGQINLYWNGQLLTATSTQTTGNMTNSSSNSTYAVIGGDIGQTTFVGTTFETADGVFKAQAPVPENESGMNIDELTCLSDKSETFEAFTQFYGISGNTNAQFQAIATEFYGTGCPPDLSASKDEFGPSGGATIGAYTYRFGEPNSDFNNNGTPGTPGATPSGDMSLHTPSSPPTIVNDPA